MSIEINSLHTETGSAVDCCKPAQQQYSDIIALNSSERDLVNRFFEHIRPHSPDAMATISSRITDLERLSVAVSRYPSMYEQSYISGEDRSARALIENLCRLDEGAKLLFLPTKAILGQGFLVAKFHIFSAISKVAQRLLLPKSHIVELRQATVNVMFTLMAEDVYMSLLSDTSLRGDVRHSVAEALTTLWEHRLDPHASRAAPVLDAVWAARSQIVPSFGTMIGTAELLMLSIELDDSWRKFIAERLGDSNVSASMEEFLFGLSFEDISLIRRELKSRGQAAIGKDEVERLLGREAEPSAGHDPRLFYQAYTKRRSNANARKKMAISGPWKTLEDHYIQFIIEKNRNEEGRNQARPNA